MSRRQQTKTPFKICTFEALEERRVFSGQSVADIALVTQDLPDAFTADLLEQVEITTQLHHANQQNWGRLR